MTRRRLAALAALVLLGATVALAAWAAVSALPRGPLVVALLAVALGAGWYGLLRRGVARLAGLALAVLALAGGAVVLVVDHGLVELVLVVAGAAFTLAAARAAFASRADLPGVPSPRRPVPFFNPKSGGGKAAQFGLADAARARGDRAG